VVNKVQNVQVSDTTDDAIIIYSPSQKKLYKFILHYQYQLL